jgi:glycosyltransferase involved in cell wall biosynthesis
MKISLITGGAPHYELGLIEGLTSQNIAIDVIGGDDLQPALAGKPLVSFKNFHSAPQPRKSRWLKLTRVMLAYLKLIKYAAMTDSKLFHIQWPYKLVLLDRTLLLAYYKLLGKRIIFTAHNVDADARDGTSTWLRQASLRFFYRHVDHLIVHTDKMKKQLVDDFGISGAKISVIPHGVMSSVAVTGMSRSAARAKLGLGGEEKVVLFFGLITPYKGIETLVEAVGRLNRAGNNYRLMIAGRIKECQGYWFKIEELIRNQGLQNQVRTDLRHVPDEEIEAYFQAADLLVLPYRDIFQSGALFLTYRFGLPVVATDVGSFREDIAAAQAGFVCQPSDPASMAQTIDRYFGSELYRNLEVSRAHIREYASENYSWQKIGHSTRELYERVLAA